MMTAATDTINKIESIGSPAGGSEAARKLLSDVSGQAVASTKSSIANEAQDEMKNDVPVVMATLSVTAGGAPIYFPVYAMETATLAEFEIMQPHEFMLNRGLMLWEEEKEEAGPLIFLSHQWTSFHSGPDPNGAQWKVIQDLAANPLNMLRKLRSQYKIIGTTRTSRRLSRYGSDDQEDVSSICIWLDYWSIPQENKIAQQHAIRSIPAYVELATCMCVIAPQTSHCELEEVCNLDSWRKRGWCRLEQLGFLLKTFRIGCRAEIYFLSATSEAEQPQHKPLLSPHISIFNGRFTCCAKNHQDEYGNMLRCDRLEIARVVGEMYSTACKRVCDDIQSYRKLLVSEWLLYDGLETKHVPQRAEASVDDFLAKLQIPDVHAELEGGMSALHYAAMANDQSLVRDLVLAAADINRPEGECHRPPLFLALQCEAVESVKILIEMKASMASDTGLPALCLASSLGRPRCVEVLLPFSDVEKIGAGQSLDEMHYLRDATPLFLAARNGNLEVVMQLLNARADVYAQAGPSNPHAGLNAIEVAASRGYTECADALRKAALT